MGARLIATGGAPAGAILAGGQATRLGGIAKGLADVGGMRIIDRIAAALRPVVAELVIVSNAPEARTWIDGARVVHDALTGGGSAAGIHAALMATARPIIAVAWDMPFVTTAVWQALLETTKRRDDATTGAPDAVVFVQDDGSLEPLCAWYAPACAHAIASAWDDGDRSLHRLLRRVHTITVPTATIAAPDEASRVFMNVNTPADLERARRSAADDAALRSL